MLIRRATPADGPILLDCWLRSVRATHAFVAVADIEAMIPQVRDYLGSGSADLWVACDDAGTVLGFMGMAGCSLEALFLAPEFVGRGIGRQLVEYAVSRHAALTVDVNEQNVAALRFYEACGFVVVGRSELDGQGRPYPLLHMKRAASRTVLLVGGTGRTGRCVLAQLLARGVAVRAIARSAGRLRDAFADQPLLTVIEGDLPNLEVGDLAAQVGGCDAVISCLGHVISLRGVFGPPRDLVARVTSRLCLAIRDNRPAAPVRFILMSSVSVNHPGEREARRTAFERAQLRLLRSLVPPARDNQRAADFLNGAIGTADPHVHWVAVRPDSLVDGEVSAYDLHEHIVSPLAKPATTRRANVADFMCELATGQDAWARWAGRLPVIVDRPA